MSRVCLAAAGTALLMAAAAWGVEPVVVLAPDGTAIRWEVFLEERGPVAVLLWSSWTPGASTTLEALPAIDRACSRRGLSLVIVDVQEPLQDARRALGEGEGWLHDRHGALLKLYRVIELPRLVIVAADGTLQARLDPTADAVTSWKE